MTSRPWFPFYVQDYMTATLDLTFEERGAYIALLCLAWLRADSAIPDDMESLKRSLGLHGNRFNRLVPPLLNRFFDLRADGQWHQARLEKERENSEKISEKAREKSRKRWSKQTESMPYDMPGQCYSQSQSHSQDSE